MILGGGVFFHTRSTHVLMQQAHGRGGMVCTRPGAKFAILSVGGATRAEDAQETPTQSHTSPSQPVYEDYVQPISNINSICLAPELRRNKSGGMVIPSRIFTVNLAPIVNLVNFIVN